MFGNNYLSFLLLFLMLGLAISSALPEANTVALHSQIRMGDIPQEPNVLRRVKRQSNRRIYSNTARGGNAGGYGGNKPVCFMFGCNINAAPKTKASARRGRAYQCKRGFRYDRRYNRCRRAP